MTPITAYQLIIFSLVFWQTDANVNIVQTGTKAGESSFQCGTKLVLTCQIDVYLLSMTWQKDNSSTPFGRCIGNTCSLDASVAGLYEISADMNVGMFNLTINQVTLENNGTSYICAHNGINVLSVVKVEDYVLTLIESTPDIITVISGCIDESTEVQFTWGKVDNAGAGKESTYEPSYITDSINITMCTGVTDCDSTGFVKKSKSLRIEQVGADEYRLRAILNYDGFREISRLTNRNYKIQDGGSHCSIKCDFVCRLLIVIGVFLFIAVIVGCLLLYVMLILCSTEKGDSTEDKWDTSYIEILLNTVSAILWIVIFILFIWSLLHCCSCDDPCCCCKIVLILRYVLGVLFGIHVILWLIVLYVLYQREDKDDEEGNKYFKTKLMKVRIVSSTIPMVGLFPVCGWLIRIYRYGNRTIHDKQVTSEKKTRELPSIPERFLTINRTEDKRNKSQKRVKKEHDKIDQFFKEDRISASEITIVKPKGKDTKNNANIQKGPDARSAFTHSVTQQPSQHNRTVLTRSQDHNKEHEKNMPDNQNHGPHSDETPQRKIDVTNKQSGSKKKSDSKDEVKPKKRKSKKETDENKRTQTTEFVITDAHTGNTQVTKRGSDDPPDSGDDASASNLSKSDKTVPNRKKSRKNKKEKEGEDDTKSPSAESHNGSETMKRALSANFHDENDDTPTVSTDSCTKMYNKF